LGPRVVDGPGFRLRRQQGAPDHRSSDTMTPAQPGHACMRGQWLKLHLPAILAGRAGHLSRWKVRGGMYAPATRPAGLPSLLVISARVATRHPDEPPGTARSPRMVRHALRGSLALLPRAFQYGDRGRCRPRPRRFRLRASYFGDATPFTLGLPLLPARLVDPPRRHAVPTSPPPRPIAGASMRSWATCMLPWQAQTYFPGNSRHAP